MGKLGRRVRVALFAVPLIAVTLAAPAAAASPMAVGSRLINGDGDTSGKCLEITDGGKGTAVRMAPCHTNAHQSWYFEDVALGFYHVRSHDVDARDRCLTGQGKFGEARMLPCGDMYEQRWSLGQAPNNWFQLRDGVQYGQCLDVRDGGLSPVVQTWDCGPLNQGNQIWHWASVG